MPIIPETEQGSRSPGVQTSHPWYFGELRFSERSCLNKQGGELLRKRPDVGPWTLHSNEHTCEHVHTCAHRHRSNYEELNLSKIWNTLKVLDNHSMSLVSQRQSKEPSDIHHWGMIWPLGCTANQISTIASVHIFIFLIKIQAMYVWEGGFHGRNSGQFGENCVLLSVVWGAVEKCPGLHISVARLMLAWGCLARSLNTQANQPNFLLWTM